METTEMTLAEFEDLAFAHGPELATWPEPKREGAVKFAASSSEARAVLADVADLQATLASTRPGDPAPSVDLMSRILADAATIRPVLAPSPAAQPVRMPVFSRIWDVFSPAAACAASAALGLWLGYAGPVDLTDVAGETFGLTAPIEFAFLDDVGASPIAGFVDFLEVSE